MVEGILLCYMVKESSDRANTWKSNNFHECYIVSSFTIASLITMYRQAENWMVTCCLEKNQHTSPIQIKCKCKIISWVSHLCQILLKVILERIRQKRNKKNAFVIVNRCQTGRKISTAQRKKSTENRNPTTYSQAFQKTDMA